MRIGTDSVSGSRVLGLNMIALAFLVSFASAASVHVVLFGGELGESYSPSSFTASIGDTIRWEGDFSAHPLSSTSIPPGAQPWHQSTGSSFDYVVMVSGNYNYQCDFHEPLMVGSFVVNVTGVVDGQGPEAPQEFALMQNFPNPFNPTTVVGYQIPALSQVKLAVYDLLGREVAVLVNEHQAQGDYRVRFGGAGLASGVYVYRLTARQTDGRSQGGFVLSRRMLLAK